MRVAFLLREFGFSNFSTALFGVVRQNYAKNREKP